ncbi:YibE/F family protein [Anaerocolumna sp.]|uniref:YibE/F family protein n=1 Tax=Anaerocolumna sp. TaxID=2041569 RepID=UPI0028A9B0AF|nr:YibE/F family protein [Anaerocolumna sp.]
MDKRKTLIIKVAAAVIFIAFFSILLYFANQGNPENYKTGANSPIKYVKAKVIKVLEDNTQIDENSEGLKRGHQLLEIKILSGEHKGETQIIDNYLGLLYNVYAKEGTRIIARIDTHDGEFSASIYNYDRSFLIYGIIILFSALLCIIGGKKGFMALVGLIFTILCVLNILVPLISKGVPVLPLTILIVVVTTIVCLILLDGINPKTFSAITGTILGVLVAGILAYIVGKLAHISGLNMEEAESMLLIATDNGLKVRDLLVAGILISALGAVMDTGMSISSAIYELHSVNPTMKSIELFQSGMNIGKDAMGTMANTLILAFAGSSLNLVLMIFAYGIPFSQIINTDLIALEIIRAITASIGIILSVPIVAFIGSRVMAGKDSKNRI